MESSHVNDEKIRIIGSGFSGLTLAYFLKKTNPMLRIVVQDEALKVGGLLESIKTPHGLVETAANAILDGEEIREMAQELQLEMIKAQKGLKKAYFFSRSKLCSWPLSFCESLSFFYKLIRFFISKNSFAPQDFESVEQWGVRCFGRPFTQKLLDAALAGIYASRVQDLSARLIFSRFFKFQKKSFFKKRKKKRGLRSTAPRLGMQHLCVRLEEWLRKQNVEFVLGKKFHLEDKKESEKLVFCGSLNAAQSFFKGFSLLQENYKEFFSLPSLPVSKTTLFFDSHVQRETPRAFGILFPRVEKRPFLGVLLDTKIFSRENKFYSESWISNETFSEFNKAQENILKERSFVFKSKTEPLSGHSKSWQKALPLYGDELNRFLLDRWPLMRRDLAKSGIYVHGNYLGHLGLSRLILESKNMAVSWQVQKK